MKIHRLIVLGVSAALVAGCLGKPKPTPRGAGAVPSASEASGGGESEQQTSPKIDQMEAGLPSTVDALTSKAQSYTRELAPLIEARKNEAQAQVAPAPSEVEWMLPGGLTLDHSPAQSPAQSNSGLATRPPVVRTVIDTPAQRAGGGAQATANGSRGEMPLASASPTPLVPPAAEPAAASESSDALSAKFTQRIKDFPRDTSAHLEYQLLQFLKDETTPQLSALSSLPPEDRELVTTVLDGMSNFRNALRADNNMLLSRKIKPLMDMSERLRSQADLTISSIVLCKSVTTFGIYEPIEPARFAAGKDHPVIVYCEVANLFATLNDKQLWETRLTWEMTLYAEQGMNVWTAKTESVVDASRNRRHDFFVRKLISIPSKLPVGRYLLKATIVDTQSNRVAEATVPLVIAVQ